LLRRLTDELPRAAALNAAHHTPRPWAMRWNRFAVEELVQRSQDGLGAGRTPGSGWPNGQLELLTVLTALRISRGILSLRTLESGDQTLRVGMVKFFEDFGRKFDAGQPHPGAVVLG